MSNILFGDYDELGIVVYAEDGKLVEADGSGLVYEVEDTPENRADLIHDAKKTLVGWLLNDETVWFDDYQVADRDGYPDLLVCEEMCDEADIEYDRSNWKYNEIPKEVFEAARILGIEKETALDRVLGDEGRKMVADDDYYRI